MQLIEKFVDQISSYECMDDIRQEELEKTCRIRTAMFEPEWMLFVWCG